LTVLDEAMRAPRDQGEKLPVSPGLIDDLPMPVRPFLLEGVLRFARRVSRLPGILRIALIGSLTTPKPEPKDSDLLVTVEDGIDLADLAKLGRQIAGSAQRIGRGAEVFLADCGGNYLGRTCRWKVCAPGLRLACDALHCGRRAYLHDDLKAITLPRSLIAAPPVELWPEVAARVAVPADVKDILAELGSSR
jgi:hypothetical protein